MVVVKLNDGKEYQLVLSAYALYRYQEEFGEDFYASFRKLQKATQGIKKEDIDVETVDTSIVNTGMSLTDIFLVNCKLLWACIVSSNEDIKYMEILKLVDFTDAEQVSSAVMDCMIGKTPLAQSPANG